MENGNELYYDSIASEQQLFAWPIEYDGMKPAKVVERVEEAVLGTFMKLRQEGFEGSFTVFMGDHPGIDVFIAIQFPAFHSQTVRTTFESFLASIEVFSGRKWRNLSSPRDGVAVPLYRFTPNTIKDYRAEDDDQIGKSHRKFGLDMTYFGTFQTLGEPEIYND